MKKKEREIFFKGLLITFEAETYETEGLLDRCL